jgi:hypothetical protein
MLRAIFKRTDKGAVRATVREKLPDEALDAQIRDRPILVNFKAYKGLWRHDLSRQGYSALPLAVIRVWNASGQNAPASAAATSSSRGARHLF